MQTECLLLFTKYDIKYYIYGSISISNIFKGTVKCSHGLK